MLISAIILATSIASKQHEPIGSPVILTPPVINYPTATPTKKVSDPKRNKPPFEIKLPKTERKENDRHK